MPSGAATSDEVPGSSPKLDKVSPLPIRRMCSLSLHDANSSAEEILVNESLFPAHTIRVGDIMQIVPVESQGWNKTASEAGEDDGNTQTLDGLNRYDHLLCSERCTIFIFKSISQEMLSRQPNLQVSRTGQPCSPHG